MLKIEIPETEFFNDATNTFEVVRRQTLQLEHSLVSISKWESKWHKSFLSGKERTQEESRDYIRCMTITQNVDQLVYAALNNDIIRKVDEYINAPMTATHFREIPGQKRSREVITSELLYFKMIHFGIPMECQKWHLNRLLTLIRVCDIKNSKPKKMSRSEAAAERKALNAQRRSKYKTRG